MRIAAGQALDRGSQVLGTRVWTRWLLGVGLLCGLADCAQTQQPFVFSAAPMAREPIEALADAFTKHKLVPVLVDAQTGTVQSRWEETGVKAEPIKGQETVIVRRYTARLERVMIGSEITLSAQTQRCVVLHFELTERYVQGECEPMPLLIAQHQRELNELGLKLQNRMQIP